MFESPKSSKLPYLSMFIEHDRGAVATQLRNWFDKHGCAVVGLGSTLFFGLAIILGTGALIERLLIAMAFSGALLLGSGVLAFQTRKPKSSKEKALAETKALLDRYQDAIDQKRLHKDMDYEALQLLEVSAYYWYSVHQEFSRPPWVGDETPAHLAAIRDESLEVATQLMRNACSLAIRCLAPAGANRTPLDDLKQSFEQLDLDGILDGFRRSLKGKKVYRSEHFELVSEPLRQIATDLRSLHEELVSTVLEIARADDVRPAVDMPLVDGALRGLRDLRAANRELREDDEPPRIHL